LEAFSSNSLHCHYLYHILHIVIIIVNLGLDAHWAQLLR